MRRPDHEKKKETNNKLGGGRRRIINEKGGLYQVRGSRGKNRQRASTGSVDGVLSETMAKTGDGNVGSVFGMGG